MDAFQCFYDETGNLTSASGWVQQLRSGVRLQVGKGGLEIVPANPVPAGELQAVISQPVGVMVGGSGRCVVLSGLPTALAAVKPDAWLLAPGFPGIWTSGKWTLEVTSPSDATLHDGTDVVAILSTGTTAPLGNFNSTTYGATTYNGGTAFTIVATGEGGWPGTIPGCIVEVPLGSAQGGSYSPTDAAHYTSDVNPDWTLELLSGGEGQLLDTGTVVARRTADLAFNPRGEYVSESTARFYNPVMPIDTETGDPPAANPFGVLTITISWPATPEDLDIGIEFLDAVIGYGYLGSAPYMTWTGDDTGASGSETVTIDLAAAWADGAIDLVAEVICRADWYPPHGGSGPATLDLTYTVGSVSESWTIHPASVSPASTVVKALQITAAGAITGGEADWSAFVRRVAVPPRAGFVYIQIIETSGVLTAVNGPFFATTMPSNSGSTYYVALAESDGAGGLEQFHKGLLTWP